MARRSPGEGSIYQREDGRWVAALTLDGKRRTVYGATRKEAAQRLAAVKEQASGGSLPDPGKRTVADLLAMWLETSAPNLKPRTLSDYRSICDLYILPHIGRVRLSRLEPAHVQRLVSRFQGEGKARTALKAYVALHKAFGLAVLWRWLPENPCDRVQRPAYRAERRDMWSAEELATFLAATEGHWLSPLWLLLLSTGARLGEALALTWEDVQGERVSITKAGQYVRGEWTVTTPKTKAGTRTVTLPAEGVAALRRQKVQQLEWRLRAGRVWEPSGLVFTGESGKPLHGSVVAHALQRACKALGLHRVTPHGLRHLHASLLLNQGLPVPVVSQRLGHAHPGITMSVYAHALKRDDDEAAAAIGRAMAGTG